MKIPESNYRFFVEAMQNIKPARMPIYEHHIDAGFISKALDVPMESLFSGTVADRKKYFQIYVDYWQNHGYDIVTFEMGIPLSCPGSGCLRLHTPPVLTTMEEVDDYPWDSIEDKYFQENAPYFEMFGEEVLKRDNIRAVGGPGYGIFETVQDLLDYTELCYLLVDDPEMVQAVFEHVTELFCRIWKRFLRDYAEPYCVCRMGDDLGFSHQTLLSHDDIRKHILPGYKKIVDLVHESGRPFLLHSCGKIFDIMEDILATGIDGKHSNEDSIAPFHEWVVRYGDRICNLGGIDMNILCCGTAQEIRNKVRATIEENIDYGGFALGCGNSIPDYIPVDAFRIMNETANEYRRYQCV